MTDPLTSDSISTKQRRIADIARHFPEQPLRSLAHHLDPAWLEEAYRATRKSGATGVDGQNAAQFAENLTDNLQTLLSQIRGGAYCAPPVRRTYIPKADGTRRALGIPTFADKVAQRAIHMLLEPVYEEVFHPFSYGFRPGRSAHQAVDHLNDVLMRWGGGWVLEVDIQDFFGSLDHQQMRELLRARVVDGTIVQMIGKWLRAGALEHGVVYRSAHGTPQGGVISPLLANIFLHEVLDEWWVKTVGPRLRGQGELIRFADDFVLVFTDPTDAKRVWDALPKRFARFGLTLHPDKSRLLPFTKPGPTDKPGEGLTFVGFTFFWRRSRTGRWRIGRKTARKSFRKAVARLKEWLTRYRHLALDRQITHLRQVLRGHYNYFGISDNARGINRFYHRLQRQWKKCLQRRSQRGLRWRDFQERIWKPAALPRPLITRPWKPAS